MADLRGIALLMFGRGKVDLASNPIAIVGQNSSGVPTPILVNSDGSPPASSVTGTYVDFHINSGGNSGTVNGVSTSGITIPTSAKRWALNYVGTGTANTFRNNTAVTGGQSFSDNASPSVAIVLAADASTVIDGFYSTT